MAEIVNQNARLKLEQVIGGKKMISKVENNFKVLQCLLREEGEKQMASNGEKLLLERLKYVSYDMEDVLDEWKTSLVKLETD